MAVLLMSIPGCLDPKRAVRSGDHFNKPSTILVKDIGLAFICCPSLISNP